MYVDGGGVGCGGRCRWGRGCVEVDVDGGGVGCGGRCRWGRGGVWRYMGEGRVWRLDVDGGGEGCGGRL